MTHAVAKVMVNGRDSLRYSLFTIHHLLFEALDEERRQIQSTDKPHEQQE
jgi:hypothetical protein